MIIRRQGGKGNVLRQKAHGQGHRPHIVHVAVGVQQVRGDGKGRPFLRLGGGLDLSGQVSQVRPRTGGVIGANNDRGVCGRAGVRIHQRPQGIGLGQQAAQAVLQNKGPAVQSPAAFIGPGVHRDGLPAPGQLPQAHPPAGQEPGSVKTVKIFQPRALVLRVEGGGILKQVQQCRQRQGGVRPQLAV